MSTLVPPDPSTTQPPSPPEDLPGRSPEGSSPPPGDPRWTPRDRGNAVRLVIGDSFWGLQYAGLVSAAVLTVLLRLLGGGSFEIGLISALDGGATALQFVGVYLLRSRRKLKAHLVAWHVFLVVPFYAAMAALLWFSPRLDPAPVRWGLLACFGGSILSIGMIMASWTDWIGHLFPERIRGTAFGAAVGAAALAGTGGALAASWLLPSATPEPRDFVPHYVLAALAAWTSMAIYATVRDPAADLAEDIVRRDDTRAILRQCAASLRDKRFRGFLIGRSLATAGFVGFSVSLIPFITQHYQRLPGLDPKVVVACYSAAPFAMAAAMLAAGYVGDHRGHRVGHIAGVVMQVFTLAVLLGGDAALAAAPDAAALPTVACVLAYLGAGAAVGCGSVSGFNLLLETCPHEGRAVHVSVGSLVLAVASIGAPLAGGALAERWGSRPLFVACLVLSLAALAWSLWRMEDPRGRFYPLSPESRSGLG